MAVIVFNVEDFRAMFTAFANESTFPDVVLEAYFDQANCYISNTGNPCLLLTEACQTLALYQMTAHIASLTTDANNGRSGGAVLSSSVGDVSVSLQAAYEKSAFMAFLSSTPYGLMLYNLLAVKSVGGYYVGSRLGGAGFRGSHGRFF